MTLLKAHLPSFIHYPSALARCFLFLFLVVLLSNCKKKQWDEYYGRPDSLEPPIYQLLTSKGHFTQLLALIDKSGYKNTLNAAGYWTLFAPNDAAFQQYFQASGISGIDGIDSAKAQAMIQYMLVFNAFNKERLDDYQANTGWMPNLAFRRRTAFYTGFYSDTLTNGQAVKAIAANRNGGFASFENNNKYIPYFIDNYFQQKNITAADYNYFYPNSQYTGFNVTDAKVLEKDIPAENGIIHEIDKVITPLQSIEEYLRGKPQYSEFKKLFDRYMAAYLPSTEITHRYQVLTGNNDPVYVKAYAGALAFSPNNENYLRLQENDAQQDSYTIFVPTNEVLLKYRDSVLLENFPVTSLDGVPPQVVIDFLNAHMWQTAVWPSKFATTSNTFGEEARFNAQSNVTDRKVLSNGFFYGTNKVQEANVFSTVYARAYLDPKYSIMTRLLDMDLRFAITNPKIQFTLFMMSDSVLNAAGYGYDPNRQEWSFTPPGGTRTIGEANRLTLLRILSNSVVVTPKGELNDLSGEGISDNYASEYIKYKNNQVFAAGNEDSSKPVTVLGSKLSKNGKVYYVDGLLRFSVAAIGRHIEKLGSSAASEYNWFWQYLRNSGSYNTATGEITGTTPGTFYTVFIPNKAAMQKAVDDGLLPGTGTAPGKTPVFNPADAPGKELVSKFIQYHILNKKTVIPDGKEAGPEETLLKTNLGDIVPITVFNTPGAMYIRDVSGRQSNVIVASSNNLSNRTVIHLTDNYLKY
jgi:uncharacterized surface protein with fasciclin (FAS1) repeats